MGRDGVDLMRGIDGFGLRGGGGLRGIVLVLLLPFVRVESSVSQYRSIAERGGRREWEEGEGGGKRLTFSPDFGTRDRPNFSIRRCNGQNENSEVTLVKVAASVLYQEVVNFGNGLEERRDDTRRTWNDL